MTTESPMQNRFLARLTPESRDRLLPHLEAVSVSADDILQDAGKRQEFAYFPTSSIVALLHVSRSGESSTVGMIGNDGLVGTIQILGDGISPQRAVVQTPGRAWRIRTPLLKDELSRGGSLLQQSLFYAQLLMTHASQVAICNRHHQLGQQLSRWLLHTLDRQSSTRINGTQEMVSTLLGVRRQGVAEAAALLETAGIISRKRGQITVLQRAKLERTSCECYSVIKREQARLFAESAPETFLALQPHLADSADADHGRRINRYELALSGSELAWWDLYLHTGNSLVHHSPQWSAMLGRAPAEVDLSFSHWNDGVHPEDLPARDAALQAHISGEAAMYQSEYRVRHSDGHWIWFAARGKAVPQGEAGEPARVVGTSMDITERKKIELALTTIANTDFLTGTASRRHFFEFAEREFARSARHQLPLSLLALDLDNFKRLNDVHGHAGGDQVLKSVVHTVGKFLRMTDVFGRTGGEEFCVLLPNTEPSGAAVLAERILQSVRQSPAQLEHGVASYTLSIGISRLSAKTPTFETLMKSADRALFSAKSLGRDRVEIDAL